MRPRTASSFLPQFTFYPSAADNSTWLKVRFGKVMEVDANDEGVSGHRVASLSSLDATFTFGTELVDGSNYTWVRLAFNKTMLGNSFKYDECPDLAGGVRRLQQTADMDLAVKVMFGFTGATTFAYGFGNTIDVPQGGLKFNIEGAAW